MPINYIYLCRFVHKVANGKDFLKGMSNGLTTYLLCNIIN